MDILKKMFESNKSGGIGGGGGQPGDNHPKTPKFGDEFRKPVWFDDCESDDELYGGNNKSGSHQKVFGFQVFTNPLEMQRHFEQQVDEMMRSLHQFEGDENPRENYLKPGFEDVFAADNNDEHAAADDSPRAAYAAPPPAGLDSDLDGEIYADQLHSLLQRISPELDAFMPRSAAAAKAKSSTLSPRGRFAATADKPTPLTDEQQVLNLIHGTAAAVAAAADTLPQSSAAARAKKSLMTPARGGIFEGAFQGPKIFRQSVMTQTVRRPDGSTETRRVVRDADGNTNTTVTRTTVDGRSETTTSGGGGGGGGGGCAGKGFEAKPPPGGWPADGGAAAAAAATAATEATAADRNIYVTKEGYAMPMNIW